jgi:very-short-patch-repair endonuclease
LENFKFRRQAPLGKYIVDFVCLEKCLIVEVDGGQHMEASAADDERTAWLQSHGYRLSGFGMIKS